MGYSDDGNMTAALICGLLLIAVICDCTEKKEACTAATEQTSDVNNIIKLHKNDTTTEEICQAGGVSCDQR